MGRKILGVGIGGAVIVGVSLVVFLPRCFNKLEGNATVDGELFEPDACRSGQRWGFAGVEIEAKDGRRMRVGTLVNGGGGVVLFAKGETRGVELGDCAELAVERTHTTINDVTNVEGHVELHCQNDLGTASGRIEFANCH